MHGRRAGQGVDALGKGGVFRRARGGRRLHRRQLGQQLEVCVKAIGGVAARRRYGGLALGHIAEGLADIGQARLAGHDAIMSLLLGERIRGGAGAHHEIHLAEERLKRRAGHGRAKEADGHDAEQIQKANAAGGDSRPPSGAGPGVSQ